MCSEKVSGCSPKALMETEVTTLVGAERHERRDASS